MGFTDFSWLVLSFSWRLVGLGFEPSRLVRAEKDYWWVGFRRVVLRVWIRLVASVAGKDRQSVMVLTRDGSK